MALDFGMLVLGGVLLYFGAEWLVGGAAGLARQVGVGSLVIGLTVVAYGTSMPEIVVGIGASVGGHGAIALGNVVGSNIANLGLILGVTALVSPPKVDAGIRTREIPMLVASAFAVPLVLLDGVVARWEGGLLVGVAVLYTGWMIRAARRAGDERAAREAAEVTERAADAAGAPESRSARRLVLTGVIGLGALLVGGHFFVEGASALARAIGMSERVVGLTIIAVGTSLPELATSLIAARRGHSDIAVGNVIGSNVFNVLLCLGLAALARPVEAPLAPLGLDLAALVLLTVAGAWMMRTERRLTRPEGGVLLLLYVAFLGALALTSAG